MEVRSWPRGRGRGLTLSSAQEPRRRRRREAVAAAAEQLLRARALDEPSSPKRKQFFLASRYHDENVSGESLLTISRDHCNFLVLDQMDKDNMSFSDKGEISELSSGSPPASLGRACYQSSELSGIVDYALLNDTYSINISDSDSKLKEHLTYLSSETDLDMQKEERFFDILKDQRKESSVLEDLCRNLDANYRESSDVQKHGPDEDSQQEYHSAEEQDYSGYHLDFDQIKTLCSPNSEVIELGHSDYEIKCADGLGENHVKKLKGGTFFSYESTHICTQGDTAKVPKLHDYLSLTEYHGQKYQRCQEQETSFTSQSVFDGVIQMSGAVEDRDVACSQTSQLVSSLQKPQNTLKANVSPDKRKSQMTGKKDVSGEVGKEDSILRSVENPRLFLERASALSRKPSTCFQNSSPCVLDESDLSAYDRSCCQFLQSTTEPGLDFPMTMPKVLAKENLLVEGGGPTREASGGIMNKTHLIKVESKYPEHSVEAACDCLITVNQTVDASSDFRACFTTSRATSARSSVASRSSNTEITMMNKARPNEWPNEKQRSIACNTDWTCLQGWAEEEARLQGSWPKDTLLTKDYLELKNKCDVKDVRRSPESQFQPSKEVENFPSKCCQKTLQRAVRAELLLLKAHYQMCHQHCWKIYRLVMEEKESFTRNFAIDFAKTELGSTLLSLFGDLKFKYLSMREKIIKGVPLDELPPLSVESRLSSFFSTFVPSKLMKEDSPLLSGLNLALDVPSSNAARNPEPGATNLKRALSQTIHASENSLPKQETAPKNESRKTQDLNIGLRNLKLDDKDYTQCQDRSEAWFDAKENLTGIDCSEIPQNAREQDKRSPESTSEKRTAEPSQREPNKSYLIHVGSLCPSVSETDLMSHFQKYQVSEVSICSSSHNYRYASLVFKKANKARMAVEEMNGKEINGQSVSVRLVKSPVENTPTPSFRNESRPTLGASEKAVDSKGSGSGSGSAMVPSRLPTQVLRPPGPEQENVYLSVDQKNGKKSFKQNKPVRLLPEPPLPFMPPNTLNLGSFTRLLKTLEGLHPNISRDAIIDALQEVRTNNKGFLSGLSLTTIAEMTTSVLKNSAFKKEEKHRESVLEPWTRTVEELQASGTPEPLKRRMEPAQDKGRAAGAPRARPLQHLTEVSSSSEDKPMRETGLVSKAGQQPSFLLGSSEAQGGIRFFLVQLNLERVH
ncbi:RNA-binding protein 44 [Dromiciops gliroides]|uniref:RNA-binding protein 44 n=1 Tax=Dromiciops gliroides TaxID=33562 RepID=UPI001CC4FE0F|nr:RNA-binding protein 44 [Dromiciops gliroides]